MSLLDKENQKENIKSTSNTIFPTITYTNNFYYLIYTLVLVVWIFMVYLYSSNLLSSNDKGDSKFLIFLIALAIYPIVIFSMSLYKIYGTHDLIGISPYYPICIYTYETLSEDEKKLGAVAKLDYQCEEKQKKFLANHGELTSKKIQYSIRILFTIIVFLFGFGKINTFQYKLITKNNAFVKALIQGAVLISIISLTVKIFGQNFGYLSAVSISFYEAIYHLGIGTLLILIAYLLYNLFANFLKFKYTL
jgi:hypothetical protein